MGVTQIRLIKFNENMCSHISFVLCLKCEIHIHAHIECVTIWHYASLAVSFIILFYVVIYNLYHSICFISSNDKQG